MKAAQEFLKKNWSYDRSDRVIAEIGNQEQEMETLTVIRKREVIKKIRGWKNILIATALGYWKDGKGMEAYVVMYDGGRNPAGEMEGVKLAIELHREGKRVNREAILLADRYESVTDGVKRKRAYTTSCLEELEGYLRGLRVEEATGYRIKSVGKSVEGMSGRAE